MSIRTSLPIPAPEFAIPVSRAGERYHSVIGQILARIETDRRRHPDNAGVCKRMKSHHSLLALTLTDPSSPRSNIEHTALELAAAAIRLAAEGDPELRHTLPGKEN
jgi:hypothetical protein